MTYPLQFAAGALINTAGSGNDFVGGTNGYGNVQFNGLPSLSNGYIVDGLETNDPLTNLNSGLSTNLVLGLNSIAEVTVNTVSYAVDQGRYGASQVNYVTKSGTNRFHGNLYELWNGSKFNAADFFTNATRRKPQAALHGESLRGKSGRPDRPRQAVLLLRFRMGADCAADRHCHHRADAGISELCPAAIAARRCGLHNRIDLSAGAPTGAVLPEALFAVRQYRGDTARGSRLSVQQRWDRCGRQSAEWKRLREPPERFAFERRSRAGANGSHRLQHRREEHGLVPVSVRHRTAGRLHRSDQSAVQRHLSAAALLLRIGLHACVLRASGELLQSRRSRGTRACSGQPIFRRRWRRFPSSSRAAAPMRRSPRSEGSTIRGCRAGAPRASSSTTISPGRSARTNSGSEPTAGSSA